MKTKAIFPISAVALLGAAAWAFFGAGNPLPSGNADVSSDASTARRVEVAPPKKWIAKRDQIRHLRMELARQDAYAFVTNRETTPPVAPYIHSQCWVDWLPKTNVEQIAYEQEKRDLGLDFVDKLEKLALMKIPIENIDALERHADRLLTIAEWWKSERGYGNHILKTWCEGIALSAAGGMAVNSQCHTNRILNLLMRIDALQVNAARRVHILNDEAPHHYKSSDCHTLDEVYKFLAVQWEPHQIEAIRHYDRTKGNRAVTFDEIRNDDRQYAFYVADRALSTPSDQIKDSWNRKNHEGVCVYGLENDMAGQILHIIKCRTLLGEIPKPTEQELDDPNLAFEYRSRLHDKWRKSTNRKERHFLGANAVLKIYRGVFVDWTTRTLQMQTEKQ